MKKISTRLAHLGNRPFEHRGVINPPVYHASTIAYRNLEDLRTRRLSADPWMPSYGRTGTPTTFAFEETVADLEGAAGAIAVESGLAAISMTMMSVLAPGDHLLVSDSVYAPVRRLCDEVLARLGIECEYYDPRIGSGIEAMLRDSTRMVYIESPGSHTFEIADVPAMMRVLAGRDIVTAFDNTWATPLHFRPLDHGIDVAIHAATKYLGGHSDLMMGVAVCNERLLPVVRRYRDLLGHAAAPDDVYLAQRGIRTLEVRLERHRGSALELARWLEDRPEVARVIHPALPSHPQHELFARDFTGSCGLFSFVLAPCDDDALAAFVDDLELFRLGASWGGYESLLLPYDVNAHRSVVPIDDEGPLVRVHVGLEDAGDLAADLERGFARFNDARGRGGGSVPR